MRKTVAGPIDLVKLQAEATAAGIAVPRGLCCSGPNLQDVWALNGGGVQVEPPAALQPVLDAHAPDPPPPTPVYGTDGVTDTQIANAVQQLRAFLALTPPSNTDIVANAKLQNRVLLAILRRLISSVPPVTPPG